MLPRPYCRCGAVGSVVGDADRDLNDVSASLCLDFSSPVLLDFIDAHGSQVRRMAEEKFA